MALNVELQQRQTEQEKLLAQRDDVSSQLQEVNRANSRLLEQLTERGQEKDKLQQELEETWKTADKCKAMLDELAIDVAQEKLRHKEELQAQIQSMEGTKGWFERRLKEAEETAEKSALEHQEQQKKLLHRNPTTQTPKSRAVSMTAVTAMDTIILTAY
ncbi:hypothetical protein AAFF_G00277850 [Aldrovandia affinis]|uniref:Uncharacterized protein n=1 Tax=Aldrovandia affinis TaxID=143900 RepID=A0AAD7RCU7_9TELE|nr:hypothetical protein AAFF_G00277850 [Aldrovandia affinis]